MSVAVDLGIVVGYAILALAVGLLAYRLAEHTAEDYYLASRTIGTVVLLFTTFATLLSAFTFFGGPNLAYKFGPEWILVMGLMDGVLFGILWYVIGVKQWAIGQSTGAVTIGELLDDRFDSTALRVLVATISLFWLLQYIMLQQVGAGRALRALTEGAVPVWAGATLLTAFMIAYVAIAGMRGVAWTDTLQGLVMLGVIWVAVVWVAIDAGGVGALTSAVADSNPEFLALGGGLYSPQWMLSTAITIAVGVTMFPQINQRFFVARSQRVLKRTLTLWPLLVVLLFVPAFMLGTWAAGLGIETSANGNILPALLDATTPGWFAAVVVAGAVAAMMSSSDSMLLSGASYLTRDLYRPLVGGSEASEDMVARIGVVGLALVALVLSLGTDLTLIELGKQAFEGYAQLAIPVALALYWSGTTTRGMIAGILVAESVYVLDTFWTLLPAIGAIPAKSPIPAIWGFSVALWCLVLGAVVTLVVSLATD
ncbi:MAG: sodium:solute symporter [Halococcoides sp.]